MDPIPVETGEATAQGKVYAGHGGVAPRAWQGRLLLFVVSNCSIGLIARRVVIHRSAVPQNLDAAAFAKVMEQGRYDTARKFDLCFQMNTVRQEAFPVDSAGP